MRPANVFFCAAPLLFTTACSTPPGASEEQLKKISALPKIWPSQQATSTRAPTDTPPGLPGPIWLDSKGLEKDQRPAATPPKEPDPVFLVGLYAELDRCKSEADKYRSAYEKNRNLAIGIASVGIIAGSIVVPALAAGTASAAWVAGVGGVAGAANAAQLTLASQGMSAAASGKAHAELTKKINEQLGTLPELKDGPQGTAFIVRLRAICMFAPLPDATDVPKLIESTEKTRAQEKADVAKLEKEAAVADAERAKARADEEEQNNRRKKAEKAGS